MNASIISVIINVISVFILFIPFIGSGTLYNRTYRWYRFYKALSFRGWVLILLALTTVLLNYCRDNKLAEDGYYKDRANVELMRKLTAENNRLINDNTRVYYEQLVKIGLTRSQADSLVQIANHKKLTNEIYALEAKSVQKPDLSFSFKVDSIDFGKEKLLVEMQVAGVAAEEIKIDFVTASYYSGILTFLGKSSTAFHSTSASTTQMSTAFMNIERLYLNEMYIIYVFGEYHGPSGTLFRLRRFYQFNPRANKYGNLPLETHETLYEFFGQSEPLKIKLAVLK